MQHLKTAKLARWQLRMVCSSAAALWASGVLWLYLHYFGQVQGEFGPEVSPLEPWMLKVHGAAMQAGLLATGSLLVVHVWRGWTYRSRRLVGSLLLGLIALLAITGYLLYYAGDGTLRLWTSVFHWAIGVLGLPLFLSHYRTGRKLGIERQRD